MSIKLGIDTGNGGYNILCNFGGRIMSGFEVWSPPHEGLNGVAAFTVIG